MSRALSGAIRVLVAGLALAALAAPPAAHAWWRGGFFVGVPVVVAPPPPPPVYYYPPPVYYAPPPAYYPPPAPSASLACHAGAYVCPLEGQTAPGAPCSCPTYSGKAWGRAG